MKVEPIQPFLEPVRKSLVVAKPPAEAFATFTAAIDTWWPLHAFSICEARARSCAIEPCAGGEVYEVRDDGARFPWGHVLTWEPPKRLVFAWHPGIDPSQAQEVEVRFSADGSGTRVDLEHRGWAALGDRAAEHRAPYEGGWEVVLGQRFAQACAA
jgi:uncharacterized protein YndB with AHSA1/START domain